MRDTIPMVKVEVMQHNYTILDDIIITWMKVKAKLIEDCVCILMLCMQECILEENQNLGSNLTRILHHLQLAGNYKRNINAFLSFMLFLGLITK